MHIFLCYALLMKSILENKRDTNQIKTFSGILHANRKAGENKKISTISLAFATPKFFAFFPYKFSLSKMYL